MFNAKIIKSATFLMAIFFVYHGTVYAQEELAQGAGLQVSPIRFDWEMESGDVRTGVVNIKNYTDGTRTVHASVENFFVSPDSEHVNLFGAEPAHSRSAFNVIDWFTLPEDFVLAPGESRNVEFIVTVPDDQPTNGYFGTILFQTTNRTTEDDDENTAEIEINYRVGTLVTLAVRGEEPPFVAGEITDLFSQKQWYIDAPAKLITEIENTGNMHFKAGGEIEIARFGERFGVIEIDPEVYYPEAVRTLKSDLPFGMWDFGVYTARMHLMTGDGRIALEAQTDPFFILPRRGLYVLGGGIAGLLCIGLLFKYVLQVSVRPGVTATKKKKKRNDLSGSPWQE